MTISSQAKEPKASSANNSAKSQGKKATGILTARTDDHVMVKIEGTKEPKRFLLAAPGGGPVKADLQTDLKHVFVSNLVVLNWQEEDQPVLTGIRAIMPKERRGVVTGTVVARENKPNDMYVDVKPSRGFTERYWPQPVFSNSKFVGLDQNVLRTIDELKPGDKVRVNWYCDERKRAVQIQIVSRAKPPRKEKEENAEKDDRQP
jgi:hypothetical protein